MTIYTRLKPCSSSAYNGPCGQDLPQGEVKVEAPPDDPVQRSLARQRVMLSRRVIAYYDLMCASLLHSTTYEFAVESSNPDGWEKRGSPI